jgi:hypothetical protein
MKPELLHYLTQAGGMNVGANQRGAEVGRVYIQALWLQHFDTRDGAAG